MRDISYSYFIFNLKYVTLQFISCHHVFVLERKTLGNTVIYCHIMMIKHDLVEKYLFDEVCLIKVFYFQGLMSRCVL